LSNQNSQASRNIQIALVLLVIFLFSATAISHLQQTKQPMPLINGYLLKKPVVLPAFRLQDHQGQVFDHTSLLGNWHLIAYGYLTCPDICPTTLLTLTHVAQQLKSKNLKPEIKFIFYSVDPVRDSSEQLSQYLAYFNPTFIGLRASEKENKAVFERSLSIKVKISEHETDSLSYSVSHDVALFITNPQGKLQAVLKPKDSALRQEPFTATGIYQDLLKVLTYDKVSQLTK